MASMVMKQKSSGGIRTLISFLSPYKIQLIVSLILSFLATSCRLVAPLVIKKIQEVLVDAMPGAVDFNAVMFYGFITLGLYIIAFAFDYSESFLVATFTSTLSKNLRKSMTEKLNVLPLSYFDSRNIGDVLSVMTNDIDSIGTTLNQILASVINAVIQLVGIVAIVFYLNWIFGLVVFIALPFEIIILLVIGKKGQKHFIKQQSLLSNISSLAEENYTAFNINKVYCSNDRAVEKFADVNNEFANVNYKAQYFSSLTTPFMTFVGYVVYALICLLGGAIVALQLKRNGYTDAAYVTIIVTCVTYAGQMTQPLSQIAQVVSTFSQTLASSLRVKEFLNEKEQENEEHKTKTLDKIEGNIEFEHVQFSYDSSRIIINDFNEKATSGQKIAIVGPTGAGKTTMVNLLMRFYDIQKGSISIEGVSTKDMNRSYVRSLFGMVLQDTWLFEGTIMENLKFSRRDASDEEVYAACKATHCEEFILQQEKGYDTLITSDGGLSQGQKQLLTIARAMIQNAPMLILDEATSSVDTRTELHIQDAMDKLMKGRTSFVIAHRLSTIKNSDLILVMKDGDVIESGNHETLMKKEGFYADLYNSQFANNMKQ